MTSDWYEELHHAVTAKRATLSWLPAHVATLIPTDGVITHLLGISDDLCDAGHIHLDILLWVLSEDSLHSVIVSEEHFDRGSETVDTTFETSVSTHPLDTVAGTQLSTASHPSGEQLDAALAIVLTTPGFTGHVDPMLGENEVPSFAVGLQPASLTFTVDASRTAQVITFADTLLAVRAAHLR